MTTSHTASASPRRSLGLLAAGAMTLALLPAATATDQASADTGEPRGIDLACSDDHEDPFTDLAGSHHETAVLCAAHVEIAEGYEDDTYRPRALVQRDHMASFITRWVELAGGEPLPEGDEDFDDVPDDSPHRAAVSKLAEAGIADGYGDGVFQPGADIHRDEMASLIARAVSYLDDGDARNGSEPTVTEQDHFSDVDQDSVHATGVDALASHGIVVGYMGSDVYGAHDGVHRDQMATFIFRAYDYAISEDIFDGDEPAVEISIDAPTTDEPATTQPGGDLDVEFTTSEQCDYSLDVRPAGTEDPDAWEILDQDVTNEGQETVAATVPQDAETGDWDLRGTCATEQDAESTVETSAVEVADDA